LKTYLTEFISYIDHYIIDSNVHTWLVNENWVVNENYVSELFESPSKITYCHDFVCAIFKQDSCGA